MSNADKQHNDDDCIQAAKYGEHNIIIYKDIEQFRKIYCKHAKVALEENNEIVLIATTYETIDNVRISLQNSAGIDVTKYENDGSLLVIDSVKGYKSGDVQGISKLLQSLALRAKKEGRIGGVLAFSDLGAFFVYGSNNNNKQDLVEYELSLPKNHDFKLKGFCCYHEGDFKNLSDQQRKVLLDHHNRQITTFAD